MFRLLFFLSLTTTAYLLITPAPPSTGVAINGYVVHFILFIINSILGVLAFRKASKNQIRYLFLFIVGFALFTELAQIPVETRDCSFLDFLADVGSIFLIFIVFRKKEKRRYYSKSFTHNSKHKIP
jgi:hypothetical protein